MVKHTLKCLRCRHRKIFEVCLTIFQAKLDYLIILRRILINMSKVALLYFS